MTTQSPLAQLLALVAVPSLRDPKDIVQTALKLSEESGEVSRAALILSSASGTSYRRCSDPAAEVAEEAVDTLLVALSLLVRLQHQHNGPSPEALDAMLKAKLAKWKDTTSR